LAFDKIFLGNSDNLKLKQSYSKNNRKKFSTRYDLVYSQLCKPKSTNYSQQIHTERNGGLIVYYTSLHKVKEHQISSGYERTILSDLKSGIWVIHFICTYGKVYAELIIKKQGT